jgi:hypothetical protein
METQPTVADDAEQQWIAKYRRAIEANISVPHSRSLPLRKCITETFVKALASVDRMLEQCVRVQPLHTKNAFKHSATQIDHSKLCPQAMSSRLEVRDSWREKAG